MQITMLLESGALPLILDVNIDLSLDYFSQTLKIFYG